MGVKDFGVAFSLGNKKCNVGFPKGSIILGDALRLCIIASFSRRESESEKYS